jgi:predicted MPP superfamily phosphohydrolase
MDRNPPQDNAAQSPGRRRFLRRVVGAASVVVATTVYGHYIGGNDLVIESNRISISRWPADVPPLRVGLLSDLHCYSAESVARTRRAIDMLLAQSPDIVLIAGDFVSHDASQWIPEMVGAIAPVTSARLGAFGVLGNHDWWCRQAFRIAAELGAVGIPILMNQSVEVPGFPGIWIVGVDSGTDCHDRPVHALRNVPTDAVKILLVHEPDLADTVPAGFAFQLSGHSHAGQVRIFGQPILTPQLARIYKQGLMHAKNHPVYVTRGVGMVEPSIRIDCPPEVSLLTLGS